MSLVTAHMVYFCAFARSKTFQKNARKSGVGGGQFDAGVNRLIKTWLNLNNLNISGTKRDI